MSNLNASSGLGRPFGRRTSPKSVAPSEFANIALPPRRGHLRKALQCATALAALVVQAHAAIQPDARHESELYLLDLHNGAGKVVGGLRNALFCDDNSPFVKYDSGSKTVSNYGSTEHGYTSTSTSINVSRLSLSAHARASVSPERRDEFPYNVAQAVANASASFSDSIIATSPEVPIGTVMHGVAIVGVRVSYHQRSYGSSRSYIPPDDKNTGGADLRMWGGRGDTPADILCLNGNHNFYGLETSQGYSSFKESRNPSKVTFGFPILVYNAAERPPFEKDAHLIGINIRAMCNTDAGGLSPLLSHDGQQSISVQWDGVYRLESAEGNALTDYSIVGKSGINYNDPIFDQNLSIQSLLEVIGGVTYLQIRFVGEEGKHYLLEAANSLKDSAWEAIGEDHAGSPNTVLSVPVQNVGIKFLRVIETAPSVNVGVGP